MNEINYLQANFTLIVNEIYDKEAYNTKRIVKYVVTYNKIKRKTYIKESKYNEVF